METMSNLCCRICLNTHSKLISIESHSLITAYEQLTSVSVELDDGLPRELCVECATLLLKYDKLRNKSQMAYGLLLSMYRKNYDDVLVNEIKRMRLEIDKLHPRMKFSDFIVHLDIEPSTVIAENGNINPQKNDFFGETVDLLSDDDDDSQETNGGDSWIPESMETKYVIDDIIDETSDLSHIDERNIESKITKTKKSKKNIKRVQPYEGIDVNNDDDVNKDGSSSDLSHIDKKENSNKVKETKKRKIKKNAKEVATLMCADKKTEKLKKKLNKLLEIHESSETFLEGIKKRNGGKISEATIRNIEILRKRQELVNDCFVKKAMLSLEEQRISFEKLKYDKSFVNARYKCELCFKGLLTEQYLQNHIRKYHHNALGEYECQLCKKRFKFERILLSHMKRYHVYEYQCNSCEASFTNLISAEVHAKYHKGIKFVCQYCGKKFETHTVYLSHVRIRHPSDDVCVYCGYSFTGETGLNQHIKKVHKDDTDRLDVQCQGCELKFASEGALTTHMRIKHPTEDQKPMYNDRQLGTRKYIKQQHPKSKRSVKTKTGMFKKRNLYYCSVEFPVPCEACGLEVTSGGEYKSHFAREHPNLKRTFMVSRYYRHMCDQCGRGFQALSILKDHLLTHGSEFTQQCPRCSVRCKSAMQLRTHLYSHEVPVECRICSEVITKRNMNRHLATKHSQTKRFQCDLCDRTFKTKGEVKPHIQHVHMNIPWPKKRKKDEPPLRKRWKIQKYRRESETESNQDALNNSN